MDARPNENPALSALRADADRLWHEGRFEEAARRYGEAAAQSADPAPFLAWQGHALRAAGETEAALEAYARAGAASPADASMHRHRGHALRATGRHREALQAYAFAVALETGATQGAAAEAAIRALESESPDFPEPPPPPAPVVRAPQPAPEQPPLVAAAPPRPAVPRLATRLAPPPRPRIAMLRAGGNALPRAAHAAGTGIAFDVSDLLLHFRGRRTLTGIQRVQAGIVGAALGTGLEASYLAFDSDRAIWRAVEPDGLSRLLSLSAAGSDTGEPAWVAARDEVLGAAASGPAHGFAPAATLVNLGNSWGIPDYFRGLRNARRGADLRYIPFLHDCVPLVMPEHCVRILVQDYARWFSSLGVHAQGVLCNSEATRADGRRFLHDLLPGLDIPMAVVPLDADPRGGAAPDPTALEGTRAPRPPEPYVLFVATIESRKDHLTVFRAWLALLRRHGPARIPRLVCVGTQGWHAEAAMNLLEGSAELARHVVLLHDISDGGLAALYRDCLFTIYNSHHEGWGLPVTESIAWGKVPLLPRHSALLESGAGAAVYVEPQSESDMATAVERLLFEPGALARAERAVADHGPGRRWEAVLADVLGALERFEGEGSPSLTERLALPLGQRLPLSRSDATVPSLALALSDTVRDGPGWRPQEGWGTPLAGGIPARLRLVLPPGTAGPLRLHLELRAGGGRPIRFALFADSAPAGAASIPAPPGGDFATALSLEVAEGTEVLELEVDAPEGTGLRALMLCREDDLIARLDFLEAQRLPAVRAG